MTTVVAAAAAGSGILTSLRPYGIGGLAVLGLTLLLYVGETQIVEGERDIVSAIAAQSESLVGLHRSIEAHDRQSAVRSVRIERELRLIAAGQNAICINAAANTEQVERCLRATDPQ